MEMSKMQLEIFKDALSTNRIGYYKYENGMVLITSNGCVGYFIPENKLLIDLEKSGKDFAQDPCGTEERLELQLTNEMEYLYKDRIVRKLTCEKFDVWVNNKYIKEFKNCTFWGGSSPNSSIIIKDIIAKNPIALICPIRRR